MSTSTEAMNLEVRPAACSSDGAAAKEETKLRSPDGRYAYNCTRQSFLASRLEVASTHWQRLRGLLGTSPREFCPGCGLLIIPSHGVHTFGMRFSIDVLFLDENNCVVSLEENVKPWRLTPVCLEAATVMELPSHTIWNTGTALGDQIEIAFEAKHKVSA